ncbi:MAG: DUF3459 domain-containing protein, partial [Anaerolineales bacterium]|nr:DUF3459 domain-containing protein [Anaerolineales bacterium]
GTEIGMSHTVDIHQTFGGDSYAREDMIWDRAQWDEELLDFYRQLIALRHKQAAVRYGERVTLTVDDTAQTYAYAHHWQGETVLTALNLSAETQVVPLPESGRSELLLSSGAKAALTEDGVVLPAKTAVVVKLT